LPEIIEERTMNAKHVALLALLALGSAAAGYAQPPDLPPDQAPPPDSEMAMDQQPPDAYPAAPPQEDLQPPPYDQPYQPADTSYIQPYRGGAVDINFFYERLSPYGHWVERRPYGWVWLPFGLRASWRPYALGRWVMTDYGWTWVSEEPFGWATYHYGRWVFDPEYGWAWVPGYEWGPAWVAWRFGAGYVGWAPLPPQVRFRVGIGLDFGGVNIGIALRPEHYCFVEERAFLAPRVAVYVQPPVRNVTIINNTTNVTNYTVVNNRVVNQGIPVQHVEQVTGRRVERLQVTPVRAGEPQVAQLRGNQLAVFQPPIVKRAATPPPPPVHVRASGAELANKHQQEAQALQQQQVLDRSHLQQFHQRDLQRGGAPPTGATTTYQGGGTPVQRQTGQPAGDRQPQGQPQRQPQATERPQPAEPQRQPQAVERPRPAEPSRQPQAEPVPRQPQPSERPATGQQRSERPATGQQPSYQQRGGASSQELAQRHQAEVQAQQQQHQREQQQLAARQRAEQQSAQRQPQAQTQQRRGGQQAPPQQQKDRKRPENPPPPHGRR
jgi:hypothetical protein